jgi:tryptophan-rich sensory protein
MCLYPKGPFEMTLADARRAAVKPAFDKWLAGTAWGSLAIRKPFTLGIARTMAPKEVWETPRFHRVNAVITTVWAAAFTVAAVSLTLVLSVSPHATTLVIAIKVLTFVLPAVFTAWYPKRVRQALAK